MNGGRHTAIEAAISALLSFKKSLAKKYNGKMEAERVKALIILITKNTESIAGAKRAGDIRIE